MTTAEYDFRLVRLAGERDQLYKYDTGVSIPVSGQLQNPADFEFQQVKLSKN